MALRFHTIMTVAITAGLVGGCSMLSFGRDEPRQPQPLAAVPSGSVTGTSLPPPATTNPPPPGDGTSIASVEPTMGAAPPPQPGAGAADVGRTDLLGGWTISAAGDSCQLFMTLTTWAGGYRASTRGCQNAALQTISAWNMEGGQVQLLNDAGSTIARLYPSSKTQFSGQTEGGGPVTVSR